MAQAAHGGAFWPTGDGEMAERIRAHDWAATPLGMIETWPRSLRTALDMVLAMPGPATILWGPAHVQLYNDAYIAIARDRHPALLGRPAAEGWPEAYETVISPLLAAARAGQARQITDLPVGLRGPGGQLEERVFDTAWSPIRDESGAVAGVLQTLVEVTDRRRAEARLRESEERVRSFAENSADTLWIVNAETGRLEYLSPAFEAMWGESRERIMGDLVRWAELVHPDDRERALAGLPRLLAGERCQQTYRIVRPSDGAIRTIQDTGFPIRDRGGRVRRVGGIAQDVTEQGEIAAAGHEKRAAPALPGRGHPAARLAGLRHGRMDLGQPAMDRLYRPERAGQPRPRLARHAPRG